MGDGIRHVAHAVNQLLDLVEHLVHRLREDVEIITSAARGEAARQLPADDGRCGSVDRLHPQQEIAPDQRNAERADQYDDAGGGRQSPPEYFFQRLVAGGVTTDQKVVATGKDRVIQRRGNRGARHRDRELIDARLCWNAGRPHGQIAGQPRKRSVGQKHDLVADHLGAHLVIDCGDQPGYALPAKDFDQSLAFCGEQLCSALLDAGTPCIEERRGKHRQHRKTQRGVNQSQARRRQLGQKPSYHRQSACSRRCASCATTAARSPHRSSGAAG